MSPIPREITEAGAWLEASFRSVDFQTDCFPQLARQAIEQFELTDCLSVESVCNLSLSGVGLPKQLAASGRFGEPPVTLFAHPRFVIDAYLWTTGTTTIHEHGFSGAFALASGSSLEARYMFQEEKRFGDTVWVGKLSQAELEHLREGDSRYILGGGDLIHSVFHLDAPSLSLCVRTAIGRNLLPVQRNFSPVGLARDAFFTTERLTLLPRIIGFGLEYRPEETLSELKALISTSDALEVWTILDVVHAHFQRALDPIYELIDAIHPRHDLLKDRFRLHYQELIRKTHLVQLRHTIDDPAHRKALALLLNANNLKSLQTGMAALFATETDRSGVANFLKVVDAMGFKNGAPNMEAIVAGFGFEKAERQALQGALESGDLSDRAIPQSLLENAAFGRFFTS